MPISIEELHLENQPAERALACPCGGTWLKISEVTLSPGGTVVIDFKCEKGCEPTLILREHEGEMFVGWAPC
jgi:hexokinase